MVYGIQPAGLSTAHLSMHGRGKTRIAVFMLAAISMIAAQHIHGQTLFRLAYGYDDRMGQSTCLLDVDGDSLLDMVTANKNNIHILRNEGGGMFSHLASHTVDNSNGFGLYDLNGDGRMDFTIAQNDGNVSDNWIAQGNAAFAPTDLGNESAGAVRSVVHADLDGDGFVDSFHSASAFQMSREGNQIHAGLPNGRFGPDIMERILPGFYYDSLVHPTLGPRYWSSLQSKGVVIRDLDRDGRADIVNAVYCDLGFQPDTFTVLWINQQDRGLFILKNNSAEGDIRLEDVSFEALGAYAHGADSTHWNAYSPVPIDYDNDGDYDLAVGATTRRNEDTDLLRLYENVSTKGSIRFVERTAAAGLDAFNALPVAVKKQLNFAAGAPLDFDNDGWVDLAFVNRVDGIKTSAPYVQLLRNNGDKTFSIIPFSQHGIGGRAGGRDINIGDLDRDGDLDIVLSDGTVGGYEGTDSTLVFVNEHIGAARWIQLEVKTSPSGTWAFDHTVRVFRKGTTQLIGMDDVRTDFCYRSKRHPALHFGLGSVDSVDVTILHGTETWRANGLAADRLHHLSLDRMTTGLFDDPSRGLLEKVGALRVFPNPSKDFFMIDSDESHDIRITDVLGREVWRRRSDNTATVDATAWPSGMYLLQSGSLVITIVKQH